MLLSVWLAGLLVSGAHAASQASAIINSAHQLPSGKYYIQNVGTGQKLVGDRNDLHPGAGKGTVVSVVPHQSGSARHTVLGVGSKGDNKCVSAAWNANAGSDGTGSMYSCVLGSLAEGNGKSTLRTDKQAFLLIPASGNSRRDLEARNDTDLIARDLSETPIGLEKRAKHHRKTKHRHTRKSKAKSTKKTNKLLTTKGAYGPYYIITSDHIQDQAPRALSGQTAKFLKQLVMKLVPWKKGDKSQEWLFIPA